MLCLEHIIIMEYLYFDIFKYLEFNYIIMKKSNFLNEAMEILYNVFNYYVRFNKLFS